MTYTLLAGAKDLALIMHQDGSVFRYNLGRRDGIVFYQDADHAAALNPGENLSWTYYGKTFDGMPALRAWWDYVRLPGDLGETDFAKRRVDKALADLLTDAA